MRNKIRSGKQLFGSFVTLPIPEVVEILGISGYDFVVFDLEHSSLGKEKLPDLIRAAEEYSLSPLIRISSKKKSPSSISKCLDAGITGIIVPKVETREEIESIVKAVKFAPLGERGACPRSRAALFGTEEPTKYFERSNQETAIIIMIESSLGFENLDSILEAEGIDGVTIGLSDLASSLGIPGQISDPKVLDIADKITAKVKEKGLAICSFARSLEAGEKYAKEGSQLIIYSTDVTLFREMYTFSLKRFREATLPLHPDEDSGEIQKKKQKQ